MYYLYNSVLVVQNDVSVSLRIYIYKGYLVYANTTADSGVINYNHFAPTLYYIIIIFTLVKDTRVAMHTRRLVKHPNTAITRIINYDRCVFIILYRRSIGRRRLFTIIIIDGEKK